MDESEYQININLSPAQVPTKNVNVMDKDIFRNSKKSMTMSHYAKPQTSTVKLIDMSAKEKEIDSMMTTKIQNGAKFKELWKDVIEPNLIHTPTSKEKKIDFKFEKKEEES